MAAAGNDANDNDVRLSFPDGYTLPNIIAVAATDQHDNLWYVGPGDGSNFGATSVDVAAPGVSILSTIPTFSYGAPVTIHDSAGFEGDTVGALPSGWLNRGLNNTWAVTDTHSAVGFHSFADSPLANYANNLISTETLTFLNIPVAYTHRDSRYQFTFDIRYDLELNLDFLDAVASSDALTWERVTREELTGSSTGAFIPCAFDFTKLVELFRATGVYLGFGIRSDASISGEGVYIDNLSLIRKPILIDAHVYSYKQGTSMAAPHVAGLAGLLLSRDPTLTVAELKTLILDGADPRPGLAGRVVTGGRINAHNSLLAVLPVLSVTPLSRDFGNVVVGQSRDLGFTVTNTGTGTLTGSVSLPAGPFSIIAGSTFSLGAGLRTTVTVRFSPTATGSFSDVVAFTSNGGAFNSAVSGIGVDPLPAPEPAANGCFLATAAFGTPLAEEVEILRRLRDERLLPHPLGRTLVSAYEKISPPLAELIRRNPVLKSGIRIILRPLIWMSRKVIE